MRLLVVGKLSGQLGTAVRMAMAAGAKVHHVETCAAATAALRAGQGADLLMVDYELDIAGLIAANALERITAPVVACGVGADPKKAADAIRAGAVEFIPLPPEAELIAAVLNAVTAEERSLVTRDPSMQAVMKLADQVAPSEASILITGESGVGKEVMARHVHARSRRADKAFVSVNCAAIPENLLESELFGHEKGAFTGALARRIGKFEEADGGTLLLDEISEMDARLQAKLLRAIQERVIDRVGGSKPVKVDIRIIATSNRNLAEAVREGTFREDLLYRLNVVTLKLPSLRERPSDILALAEHFGKKYAAANSVPERAIGAAARERLLTHPWPGNVRELENAMHRAVLLSTGAEIDPESIRLPDGAPLSAAAPAQRAVQAAEAVTRGLVGPHRGGGGAAADHRHARSLPGQPHPRGQHPGHQHPHPAQQAERIFRGRGGRAGPAVGPEHPGGLISHGRRRRAPDILHAHRPPGPGLGGAWRGGAGAGRDRHHRDADPAGAAVHHGSAAGVLAGVVGADPDDGPDDQEAAGVHRLPDGAAGQHPVQAGPEPRHHPADPEPRARGRRLGGRRHRGLRAPDDGRQLHHRGDRLRHPGDREFRGDHQGFDPDRRGRRAVHPGLDARQADGDRRRPVFRPRG
jgi:DNA-binding NtrC family response regulator